MQLRGPSAAALATLESQLLAKVSAVAPSKAAQIGEDLLGAAGVLRSTAGLRRIVTDPSIDVEARAGLVRKLFGSKVDTVSLDVLLSAVRQRWTATRDLADALEHLGVDAVVRSADDPDRVADELFAISQLLQDNVDLRDALGDPGRSQQDKRVLLDGLLAGKVNGATTRLVEQGLTGGYRSVAAAILDYQRTAVAVRGERVATVRSARPLTEGAQQRLQTALAAQYGREVHLNLVVDQSLVGGLRVEFGDDVIDGTVASRLADARRKLAG